MTIQPRASRLQVAAVVGFTAALTAGDAQAGPPAAAGRVDTGTRAVTPAPSRPHHLRMMLELSVIFAAGNRWYWRDGGEPNRVDWQLPWGAEALQAKLASTDGWRFDGNPYDINALGHPGFGTMTHFLARENGYGLGEAFLISTLASGTWEVALEWAEYGSLNDMASTSTAGVPLGETAYQVLHHPRATRFELRSGVGTENGTALVTLGVGGALDRIPTRGHGTFRGGRRVEFSADLPSDARGVRAYEGGARALIAGYYENRGDRQVVAGVATRFGYRKQADRPERAWDLLTTVGVGPTLEYQLRCGDLTLRVGADVDVEFAMLKAQAFEAWRAEHPDAVTRNVMSGRARPYYFAVGASADPRVQLSLGKYHASARLLGRAFGSIDGADRDQEMVTDPVHFTDDEAQAEARIGYTRGDLALNLDGRLHRRGGRADHSVSSSREQTALVTVALRR